MLGNRKFSFSIIVHADSQGPLINFHQSSPILNVRSDCPAAHLLDFLTSEGGVQASEAANEVHSYRAKEEALLERVRQVGYQHTHTHTHTHGLSHGDRRMSIWAGPCLDALSWLAGTAYAGRVHACDVSVCVRMCLTGL